MPSGLAEHACDSHEAEPAHVPLVVQANVTFWRHWVPSSLHVLLLEHSSQLP